MGNPKGKTDPFNTDMLDDGVLRPVTPVAASVVMTEEQEEDMAAKRQAALERLRAEIQIGLDEYAAGQYYEVSSVEELYNLIMSDDDDVEADEAAQDRDPGRP